MAATTSYDITTLGEILIDFTVQGTSPEGQALFAQNPGGAPANVAVAAQKLGAKTAFIGKAGADMHGEFLRSVLAAQNVETSGLVLDPDCFTTLAFVNISPAGERTFSFARKPGADTQLRSEEINPDILEHTRILHTGSLSLTDQPSRDATFSAVSRARECGSILSYDPNYRASLWENESVAMTHMRSMIPWADVMKISDEETALLTDFAAPEDAAMALFKQGVKVVAVTLGAKGAYVLCRDGGRFVPGFAGKAVDTNGAGDCFWGAFLYQLSASGKRPEDLTLDEIAEFARFGNAAASCCIQKKGAIPAMPELFQVKALL